MLSGFLLARRCPSGYSPGSTKAGALMAGAGAILFVAMLASAGSGGSAPSIRSAAQFGAKWGLVTSVLRSPEHNRLVGGVPNSFHLSGQAVDIARRPGVRHGEIEAAFRKAGFVLIESLDEGDHSHFAFELPGGRAARPKAKVVPAVVEAKSCAVLVQSASEGRRRPDRFDSCAESASSGSETTGLRWANEQVGTADRLLKP